MGRRTTPGAGNPPTGDRLGTEGGAVGLLDRFEQRLDRMVNGAFARAFKAEVQPVEIASALTREMDDRAAVVSRGRTVVPNVFVVDLSPHDHDRLSVYSGTLTEELSGMVREYAEEQRYTFLGGTTVELTSPPTMMIAIGPSISRPGSALPSASGSRPRPVTRAVIRIDGRRSSAPSSAVSRFHGRPSSSIRCW